MGAGTANWTGDYNHKSNIYKTHFGEPTTAKNIRIKSY